MPDHLRRHAPFQGEPVVTHEEEDDEEAKQERDWLASSLRFLTTEESTEVGVIRRAPQTYRLATQWWCYLYRFVA